MSEVFSGVFDGLAHLVMHHATVGDYALGVGLLAIGLLWAGYCLSSVYVLAKVHSNPRSSVLFFLSFVAV